MPRKIGLFHETNKIRNTWLPDIVNHKLDLEGLFALRLCLATGKAYVEFPFVLSKGEEVAEVEDMLSVQRSLDSMYKT
jgi:hypothetical protein